MSVGVMHLDIYHLRSASSLMLTCTLERCSPLDCPYSRMRPRKADALTRHCEAVGSEEKRVIAADGGKER